jgi:hypothetical protein
VQVQARADVVSQQLILAVQLVRIHTKNVIHLVAHNIVLLIAATHVMVVEIALNIFCNVNSLQKFW